jgi:DegV family protein with EDD domain
MAVAIVTDSAAALPSELVGARGIEVVPMWLDIGGRSVREDEVTNADVLRGDVVTSGPTPGDFECAMKEQLRSTDDGVLVLTVASTMSVTYASAVTGAQAAGDANIRVLDTNTAAGAQALVVLAASDAAHAGAPLDEVEAAARRASEQVRLRAALPSLDHLVHSGRVPNIAAWAGRRLGIVPLFEFRAGSAHPVRPARGMPAALDRIVSAWRRDRVDGARLHVVALHADAPDEAQALRDSVCAEAGDAVDTAFVGTFGTVMIAHTGPGLVGLAWRWELLS